MLEGIKSAVAFFAHSDDEFIAAGTLHRLVKAGAHVSVIAMCPAATEHDRQGTEVSWKIVQPEFQRSMELIGVKRYECLKLMPSCDLQPHRQRICQYIFDYCELYKPDAAFILSPEDENTAHSIVGIEAERVMRGRVPITIRCQYPWNFGAGKPNLFVSLSDEELAVKQGVIDAYQSQKFRYNYSELLLHQVRADGLSVKVAAAEKFELVRGVF